MERDHNVAPEGARERLGVPTRLPHASRRRSIRVRHREERRIALRERIRSTLPAGADGSADVSNILAGIQWVVSFKDRYGIKVLNLSLGTDSTQSYRVDPDNAPDLTPRPSVRQTCGSNAPVEGRADGKG